MGQLTSNNDKTRHKVLGIMTVDDITLSQGKGNTFAHGGKGPHSMVVLIVPGQ